LEQALSLQPDRHSEHDDDDVQDADGRYKDWSQLGTYKIESNYNSKNLNIILLE
jgi:hypothetical protein